MLRILICIALVPLALAEPLHAQLELPRPGRTRRPERPRTGGNVAPYIECTVCHEHNITAPRDLDSRGYQQAHCAVCKKATLHKAPSNQKGGRRGALELPAVATERGARTTGTATPEPAPVVSPATEPAGNVGLTDHGRAASFVFDEVAQLEGLKDPLADKAVESLLNFGEAGRMAARVRITSDHGPTILVAARVLLQSGVAPDAEAVTRRMQGRLPNRACRLLIDVVVELDPVRGSPALLCKLLDHRQGAMRSAAENQLERMLSPAVLPQLELVLQSRRSDARARAIALLKRLDGPDATDVLLAHVGDPTASVAWGITEALAAREDPRLDTELLSLAFRERWILRREAYALLTIIEREDRRLEPILDASHIDPLLSGMASRDPFVSGASSAALAGIGFRTPQPDATAWLDREVPDRLVYALSGREFHNDYSSLQDPVLRRLQRISDEAFGSDGPAWAAWWLDKRDGFYARRAWIAYEPEDQLRLSLLFKRGGIAPAFFALLGPEAEPEADERVAVLGEVLRLSRNEVADLMRLCEREGLFGPERLPGLRGSRGSSERMLELRIGGHGKEFTFGASASEPWFERVVTMAEELRVRNRWQRYGPQATGEDAAARSATFLREEGSWWGEEHDELERAVRLKRLVLRHLPELAIARREGALAEIERLYAVEGVPERSDFGLFVQLIEEERFFAERARELAGFALRAAAAAPLDAMEDGATLEREDALELVRVLHDRFGPPAAKELTRVFEAAGPAFVREMASSEGSLMRAVSAAALADDPDEEDVTTLLGLLGDESPNVEVAAVLALGHKRIEAARTELLVRARAGSPEVRKAALRSVGKLGGEYVMEALLLGLTNEDKGIQLAAAQGLAELRDPRATSYLIRFLSEPIDSPMYAAGHDGLERLGESARVDLLRVLHTPEHPGRRAATLLLAEQRVPEAVPALIRLLQVKGKVDDRIARELAVLTCVDLREHEEPARAWWEWWDSVLHDDALAWFRACLELHELDPPSAEAFRKEANLDTARYLLGLFEREETWLVERARRELERILGRRIPALPPPGTARERWLTVAESWLDQGSDVAPDVDR